MDVAESLPEVMGGTPVFKGTRVPVQTLFDYLEAGDTAGDFLDDFPSVSETQATLAMEMGRDRFPAAMKA